ncbi:MAG: TIGR04255 family protein [Opitutaceae bacterium]|nr:TIGR04255 family protein [Opitutaceae bacterium]
MEAIFEIRFVPRQPWENLPGLLHAQIKGHYPEQATLPLYQIPEEFRRQQADLKYQPLIRFFGNDFSIHLGPCMVALITKSHGYPGWNRIHEELRWLMDRLMAGDFIEETERLGVRYVDFIEGNVFDKLKLALQLAGEPVTDAHTEVTTILKDGPLTIRLAASNGAIVGVGESAKSGSVLDLDAWYGALGVELFDNGLNRFSEAHQAIKSLFFGLLKDDFLNSLNPLYE